MKAKVQNSNAMARIAQAATAIALGIACFGTLAASPAYAADGQVVAAGVDVEAAEVAPLQTQAENDYMTWYNGQEGTYEIRSLGDLKSFAAVVNNGVDDFEGKTVALSGLLILAGQEDAIEPIGTESHPFQGTFDGGRGSTGALVQPGIANLTVDVGSRLSYVGLFGYAGEHATIQNLSVYGGDGNPLAVTNKEDGKVINYVGAIAGYLGGSMHDCYSSVEVAVTNDGKVPNKKGEKPEELCTILGVGGLVGCLGGDMVRCTHADAELRVSSTSGADTNVPFIAGYIGGLAGIQGDVEDAERVLEIADCANTGSLLFDVKGSGDIDRFGVATLSPSNTVGGVVGYSMGNIQRCSNAAELQTGVVIDGETQDGYGALNVGGIVGSQRGPLMQNPSSQTGVVGANATDPGYDVWKKSKGTQKAPLLTISECSNTGDITGLASIGGICGSGGTFTQIIACSNTATIEGTRWNKPCPAGIAGITNGDIRYCYNRGRCFSTTGGGYYSAGITSLLTTYNTSVTPQSMLLDPPVLCGCYVTGLIGGEESGYRTGVIVGENDGYVYDNCVLPNLSTDKAKEDSGIDDGEMHSRLVAKDENRGKLYNNYELDAQDMKSSKAVSYLNKPNARKGDWSLYYVPVPDGYPVLNWQASSMALPEPVDISSIATGIAETVNPQYSASFAPIPEVSLNSSSSDQTLYQDADYKVVVDEASRAVGGSYKAQVVGINGYTGTLAQQVDYSIAKADIGACRVTATPIVFNWEQQAPKSVTVLDAAGNVVDPSEYTFKTLANADGSTDKVNGKYYDYINCHGANYRYDIEVTALPESANYTGSTVQAAFQIKWASMYFSVEEVTDNPNLEESVKLGDVVYSGQTWDIKKALKEKGYVKIKYTGNEIKPKCSSVTYLGREMRDGTGNSDVSWHPLNYDYKYVYGNPNPESGKDADGGCINATGSDPANLGCMTVRFTTGGNFDNYTNVFYEITPASMSGDVKVTGIKASYPYTGKSITVPAKLTYNNMTLVKGRDYTVKYENNLNVGKARVTFTGVGNYAGSKTFTFAIAKAPQPLKLSAASRTIKHAKLKKGNCVVAGAKATKAKGVVTYKKVKVNKSASKFSVDKKTGKITVKKGTSKGTYKVKIRATAAGNKNFKSGSKVAIVTVKVK